MGGSAHSRGHAVPEDSFPGGTSWLSEDGPCWRVIQACWELVRASAHGVVLRAVQGTERSSGHTNGKHNVPPGPEREVGKGC